MFLEVPTPLQIVCLFVCFMTALSDAPGSLGMTTDGLGD